VPEERWEWVVFSVGIAAVAVLLALIVFGGSPKAPDDPVALTGAATTASTSAATTIAATTATAPTTGASAPTTTTSAPTTTTVRRRPAAPPVRLRLTARADTWLSVHRTSSGGRLLYQGTLAAGATRTFSGSSFEVRFGAAANVQATLNGKPLPLPGGTYTVTVGRSGLGPRAA
jgi:pyruvate/2-oxoglutarate dehydrogenase complex dihydrolipoamide acyltransferase (E2) component